MEKTKRDSALLTGGPFGEKFATSRFYFLGEFFQTFSALVFLERARFYLCQTFADTAANAAEFLFREQDVHLGHAYLSVFVSTALIQSAARCQS